MGNCASVDPACATLEHPTGEVEKLDFSSSARQLMLQHPGHYVALLPPSPPPDFVHVKQKLKLLPPDTTLIIGSCYRLVSFEDVLLELSDSGNMTHQTSRKQATVCTSQHQSDLSNAVKRINQLRAMLSKSLVLHKENVPRSLPVPMAPAAAAAKQFSSGMQSLALQSLYPGQQRVGSWRPNLQSISERGR